MQKKRDLYLDIIHIYLSDMVAGFTPIGRNNFYGATTGKKIQRVITAFFKALKIAVLSLFNAHNINKDSLQGKHWLYVLGTNNYNSLSFIKDFDKETIYVSPYNYKVKEEEIHLINLTTHFFYLLKSLPTFFNILFTEKRIHRCWDVAFESMGLYESSRAFLKKYTPRCITFSNDHAFIPRAMILAAKSLNIPTFYIQHACVREDFPPLRFSHSFLEGQDALNKYTNAGKIDGEVSLIGIPRMDKYILRKNINSTVKRIGICSNLLDDIPTLEKTISALVKEFNNVQFSYRPHPNDVRKINLPLNVMRSNSKEVNPFEFLVNHDLVIAGNTSIHYEAAMIEVHSIYHKFIYGDNTKDMYNFVKNGLIEEAVDLPALINLINKKLNHKESLVSKARYYNAALGTEFEGNSQGLVIAAMKKILKYGEEKSTSRIIS